eukprot:1155077-Pelagomonas_calceolata.AAC.7
MAYNIWTRAKCPQPDNCQQCANTGTLNARGLLAGTISCLQAQTYVALNQSAPSNSCQQPKCSVQSPHEELSSGQIMQAMHLFGGLKGGRSLVSYACGRQPAKAVPQPDLGGWAAAGCARPAATPGPSHAPAGTGTGKG